MRASEDRARRFREHFATELSEIDQRVEDDPRLVEAETQVAACVRDAGFDEFVSIDGSYGSIQAEVEAISLVVDGRSPLDSLSEEEIVALGEAEPAELAALPPPELTADERAELAEIQEHELALTAAIEGCDGIPGLSILGSDLRAEYETAFLEDDEGAILAYLEQDEPAP